MIEDNDTGAPQTCDYQAAYHFVSQQVLLLKSVYENRPPTIFFPYPPWCQIRRETSRTLALSTSEMALYDLKYKMGAKNHPFFCVTTAFQYAGFQRTFSDDWNGLWGKELSDGLKNLNKYQKSNHFPGCWNLGRKDQLYEFRPPRPLWVCAAPGCLIFALFYLRIKTLEFLPFFS